jgi:hypothetical protein
MHHQELHSSIHGGILADEMGMGKTIQTIATILDNRPKLLHCKPGSKHPMEEGKEREDEEKKWDKCKEDWVYEMDILKVMKKIRSKDGGGRAGELLIHYLCFNSVDKHSNVSHYPIMLNRHVGGVSSDCSHPVED